MVIFEDAQLQMPIDEATGGGPLVDSETRVVAAAKVHREVLKC